MTWGPLSPQRRREAASLNWLLPVSSPSTFHSTLPFLAFKAFNIRDLHLFRGKGGPGAGISSAAQSPCDLPVLAVPPPTLVRSCCQKASACPQDLSTRCLEGGEHWDSEPDSTPHVVTAPTIFPPPPLGYLSFIPKEDKPGSPRPADQSGHGLFSSLFFLTGERQGHQEMK